MHLGEYRAILLNSIDAHFMILMRYQLHYPVIILRVYQQVVGGAGCLVRRMVRSYIADETVCPVANARPKISRLVDPTSNTLRLSVDEMTVFADEES